MRLPKEKIIFVVDTIPVGSFPGRGMIDFFPLETEDFIKKVIALDWERLIPGHPGAPNGRLGTKEDAKNVLALYQDASAEMKKLGQAGKCWDDGREGVQAAEVREHAGLRQRPAVRGAALLRPVGPRHLIASPTLNIKRAALASGPFRFCTRALSASAPRPPPWRSTPRSGRTGWRAPPRCGCRRGPD